MSRKTPISDHLVLVSETTEVIKGILEACKGALESQRFRVNVKKTINND